MRADLHIHSHFSDGAFSPRELFGMAKQKGIEMMSITDHDIALCEEENYAAAEALGMLYIPGIEFTCYDGEQIHILGYSYKRTPAFCAVMEQMTEHRKVRNGKILKKLEALGIYLNESEIDRNHIGLYGTVQIVRQIVRQGYETDYLYAMKKYFTEGALAYVGENRMAPKDAVSIIKAAGGVAVWAHPGYTKLMSDRKKESLIRHLKDFGLDGIESHYFRHTEKETELYCSWAKKYHLISTVGSDFHGEERREILGVPAHDLTAAEVDFLCKKRSDW